MLVTGRRVFGALLLGCCGGGGMLLTMTRWSFSWTRIA